MKWYYVAIPAGIIVAYLVFSSKGSLRAGNPGAGNSKWGGILTGGGNLLTGASNLWDSISGSFKSSDDPTSDTAE